MLIITVNLDGKVGDTGSKWQRGEVAFEVQFRRDLENKWHGRGGRALTSGHARATAVSG